ncbi:MAG: LLM class flavin-dependent oxidoreductase [Nocardiopsaceae bacterium]|jgi:alkanesulfonate monooxygenase SsuD/methylene tetrahydromethanopterin reductase-like flavin-dependent oxidoreductase (luciferase family)|nr:LLM class flavin-dependent oxidoreductase [Nocardiopsaceae bacterium]
MDVGIGLPNAVPDTGGRELTGWARLAEERGFSTLGTIGRLVYPSYDELIALTAAAAVTERIRLTTSILLAPLQKNAALFAKQAASLDRVSGGRFVLGVAVGGRADDFAASEVTEKGRGRRLDEQLDQMRQIWRGEGLHGTDPIGPSPVRPGGPELIIGGRSEASFRRAARVGDGWIMGGGSPDMFASGAAAVDKAWQDAGRTGRPRKLSLAYFSLGPDARAAADSYLTRYYAFIGEAASQIAAGAAVSADMVRSYTAAFEQAGCDELIFMPCSAEAEQVRLLADAIQG